jgi:hypothetical protein
MTQVLIDTGLPCFDDVLAKYAFTYHHVRQNIVTDPMRFARSGSGEIFAQSPTRKPRLI